MFQKNSSTYAQDLSGTQLGGRRVQEFTRGRAGRFRSRPSSSDLTRIRHFKNAATASLFVWQRPIDGYNIDARAENSRCLSRDVGARDIKDVQCGVALLGPLIIEYRLLRSGGRAHPYTARFLSSMDSSAHCSLECFILLLTSGGPDLFTGRIRIKGYRSGHDATPSRFVRAQAHHEWRHFCGRTAVTTSIQTGWARVGG
jgi:hypothetical protein